MTPNDLSAKQLLALAKRHVRRFKRLLDPSFPSPESVRRDECEAYLALWTKIRDYQAAANERITLTPEERNEVFDAIDSGDSDNLFTK
jgi:hypothetical protein